MMTDCPHDLAERETACADGACPICLRQQVEIDQAIMRRLRERHDALREVVGFFRSVINSGEPWTQSCEQSAARALLGECEQALDDEVMRLKDEGKRKDAEITRLRGQVLHYEHQCALGEQEIERLRPRPP